MIRAYSRTYAHAVNGMTQKQNFNFNNAHYELSFIPFSSDKNTEIRFQRRIFYENGVNVTVVPKDSATVHFVEGSDNIVLVKVAKEFLIDGNDGVISVFVEPL